MLYADIHCHILPGIDDGSPDEETSLEMLRREAREGTETIIFTPHHKPGHHNASPRTVRALTRRLQELADAEGLALTLYPGNEILYSGETAELLLAGEALTLAGSDHALIEFYPTDPYERIRGGLYEVLAAGFVPVLAHVERYIDIVKHPERVKELSDMGVRIQVNASSVMGKYGFGIKSFTRKLLKQELADFIATDAHDLKNRAPKLKDCAAYVERRCGRSYASRLFCGNARELTDACGAEDGGDEGINSRDDGMRSVPDQRMGSGAGEGRKERSA